MTALAAAPAAIPRRAAVVAFGLAAALAGAPALAPLTASAGTLASSATRLVQGVSWESVAGSGTSKLDPGIARTGAGSADVVVTGGPGSTAALRAAVEDLGGTVTKALPLVDGLQVTIPRAQLAALADVTAVRAVTLNRSMRFEELTYDETTTSSAFTKSTGATSLWAQNRTGKGVGVAVLDTGVSPMKDFEGRLVHGPDLSGEGTYIDTYGHGTVMAGIVGGSGADTAGVPGGATTGIAPTSTLVAVKVAGRNGATDVSTVLQGMHWVAAYKEAFNIRVLNLSWGTPSTQSPALDPLNFAVERLWQQGIVVVVAAGNSGPGATTILKPADDPLVITAGAYDDKGDLDPTNDVIPSWASRGPTAHGLVKPDVVTPGRTIVASRSFGSKVEAENTKALISPSYIKGSGTSQAAAVTSGAVALLLQQRPELTPDQVKRVLKSTASPIEGKTGNDQGAGRVRLAAAAVADPGAAVQQTPVATGLGSLELSRGGRNVQTDCGNDGTVDVIRGEIDTHCEAWNGAAWTGAAWTGAAWTGAAWTGAAWTGSSWAGAAWTGAAWTGAAWTGAAWTGAAWTGAAWTGAAWTGAAWTGSSWTGAAWTGAAWTGAAWTGAAWTGNDYTSAEYGDSDFLNAFWGPRPKAGKRVAGEISEAPSRVQP